MDRTCCLGQADVCRSFSLGRNRFLRDSDADRNSRLQLKNYPAAEIMYSQHQTRLFIVLIVKVDFANFRCYEPKDRLSEVPNATRKVWALHILMNGDK
jgi:hypothetical protein